MSHPSTPSIQNPAMGFDEADNLLHEILHANLPSDSSVLPVSMFEHRQDMPIINPEKSLEQCMEWEFVVELLEDILKDSQQILSSLQKHLDSNDHTEYHKTAHAIKGAALNLHLPAIVDVSRKAELLGKQLEECEKNQKPQSEYQQLLDLRARMIEWLKNEYQRLQDAMPEIHAIAEEQGGDEQEYEEYDENEEEIQRSGQSGVSDLGAQTANGPNAHSSTQSQSTPNNAQPATAASSGNTENATRFTPALTNKSSSMTEDEEETVAPTFH